MEIRAVENPTVKVVLCMGSSCFSRGSNRSLALLQDYLKAQGLEKCVRLEGRLCQEQCKNGPNVTINGTPYPTVNPGVILDLVKYHLDSRK